MRGIKKGMQIILTKTPHKFAPKTTMPPTPKNIQNSGYKDPFFQFPSSSNPTVNDPEIAPLTKRNAPEKSKKERGLFINGDPILYFINYLHQEAPSINVHYNTFLEGNFTSPEWAKSHGVGREPVIKAGPCHLAAWTSPNLDRDQLLAMSALYRFLFIYDDQYVDRNSASEKTLEMILNRFKEILSKETLCPKGAVKDALGTSQGVPVVDLEAKRHRIIQIWADVYAEFSEFGKSSGVDMKYFNLAAQTYFDATLCDLKSNKESNFPSILEYPTRRMAGSSLELVFEALFLINGINLSDSIRSNSSWRSFVIHVGLKIALDNDNASLPKEFTQKQTQNMNLIYFYSSENLTLQDCVLKVFTDHLENIPNKINFYRNQVASWAAQTLSNQDCDNVSQAIKALDSWPDGHISWEDQSKRHFKRYLPQTLQQ